MSAWQPLWGTPAPSRTRKSRKQPRSAAQRARTRIARRFKRRTRLMTKSVLEAMPQEHRLVYMKRRAQA